MIDRYRHTIHGLLLLALFAWTVPAQSQEVIVFAGIDEAIDMLKQEDFWGEEKRGEHLDVPHIIFTGINPRWRTASQALPVPQKKEIFYRAMLPRSRHANGMGL